jgi:hypothetical protein
MFYTFFIIYATSIWVFLSVVFVAIYLFNILSWPRRRGRLRSADARRSSRACFLSQHLMRQGDQEAQRSIDYILSLVNRKIYGTVAPRRAVASTVVAVADDRGQQCKVETDTAHHYWFLVAPWVTDTYNTACKKKKLNMFQYCNYVPYRTRTAP